MEYIDDEAIAEAEPRLRLPRYNRDDSDDEERRERRPGNTSSAIRRFGSDTGDRSIAGIACVGADYAKTFGTTTHHTMHPGEDGNIKVIYYNVNRSMLHKVTDDVVNDFIRWRAGTSLCAFLNEHAPPNGKSPLVIDLDYKEGYFDIRDFIGNLYNYLKDVILQPKRNPPTAPYNIGKWPKELLDIHFIIISATSIVGVKESQFEIYKREGSFRFRNCSRHIYIPFIYLSNFQKKKLMEEFLERNVEYKEMVDLHIYDMCCSMRMLYCDKPDKSDHSIPADRPFLPEMLWIKGAPCFYDRIISLIEDPYFMLKITSLQIGYERGFASSLSELGKSICSSITRTEILEGDYQVFLGDSWILFSENMEFDFMWPSTIAGLTLEQAESKIINYINSMLCVVSLGHSIIYVKKCGKIDNQQIVTFYMKKGIEDLLAPLKFTYANEKGSKQTISLFNFWNRHPKRLTFSGIISTCGEVPNNYLNLWTGACVKIDEIRRHREHEMAGITLDNVLHTIREVIVSGNEHYDWLCWHLGMLIKRPDIPQGVYTLFVGPEGTGKDLIISNTLKAYFGQHMFITANANNVFGEYTNYPACVNVIWINEMEQIESKPMSSLKGTVTDSEIRFNEKYIPSMTLKNPINLFSTSNSVDPTVFSSDSRVLSQSNRRLQILTGSNALLGCSDVTDFYSRLADWLKTGGRYCLINYFLSRYEDVEKANFNPRLKVYSSYESEKKICNMSITQKWLLSCLKNRTLLPPSYMEKYRENDEAEWNETKDIKMRNLYRWFLSSLVKNRKDNIPTMVVLISILERQIEAQVIDQNTIRLHNIIYSRYLFAKNWFNGNMEIFNSSSSSSSSSERQKSVYEVLYPPALPPPPIIDK